MSYHVLMIVPTAGEVDVRNAGFCEYQMMRQKDPIAVNGMPLSICSSKAIDCPVDFNRNQAVSIFLNKGSWTHLFFLDSDVSPPLDAIDRLLALEVPVATGLYPLMLREGLRWAILNKDPGGVYRCLKYLKSTEAPFEVDGAGAGCLLIRRDILKEMSWPYFRWDLTAPGQKTGEDVFFSKKLNANRHRITVDPTILCNHYKTINLLQLMQVRTEEESHGQ